MVHTLGNKTFEVKHSISLQDLISHYNTLYNDGTHGEYENQVTQLKRNGSQFKAK